MPSSAGYGKRLSRNCWLNHALAILRDEGIQGVRIDRMARDLGVTKGSFYWHFKHLEDLRRCLLDYWSSEYSDVISESGEYLAAEPAAGLLAAMTRVRQDGLDEFEVAMRSWADHDSVVDAAVREVYARRTKFVRSFFTRLGFRGLDAEMRTQAVLCYMSWEPSMYPGNPAPRRLKLLKLHLELMMEN